MSQPYQFLENFLWDGSNLFPTVEKDHIDLVVAQINEYKDHPIYAITKEVQFLGETAFNGYLEISNAFNNYYKISKRDIALFFQGFNIPLNILIKLYTKDQFEIEGTVKISGENLEENKKVWALNGYILHVFHTFRDKHNSSLHKKSPTKAIEVFDFCETSPFDKNKFYLLGIISSKTIFREFTTQINIS